MSNGCADMGDIDDYGARNMSTCSCSVLCVGLVEITSLVCKQTGVHDIRKD